jgi:P27 family predicted phage terminase small subunit
MRGRKPFAQPGNPALTPPPALPRCPAHLSPVARNEWRRLASTLHEMGILTVVDRAALAAYCQCYARWVEAEEKLTETPILLKTPSGYAQQSPWLSISNKQLELMARYMAELGLTPSARQRLAVGPDHASGAEPLEIKFITTYEDCDGKEIEQSVSYASGGKIIDEAPAEKRPPIVIRDAHKL